MPEDEERISEIRRHGKAAQGRAELLKHLGGKRLTRAQAIKAKCYECEGYFADGRVSCPVESCPLHPFNPYRGKPTGD